jgi:hypothetical protein
VNIDVTPGVASQGSGTQPKAMPSVRPAITPSPRPFINDAMTMPNVGRVSVGCFACAIVSLARIFVGRPKPKFLLPLFRPNPLIRSTREDPTPSTVPHQNDERSGSQTNQDR